ncbi:MAG: hypothetical protein MI975_21260 [Cytophagales bacterium]|nr:hypothetical protein [Cytophagales bacterium]
MKQLVLIVLAFFVFSLVTAGEHANNLLERKTAAKSDISPENKESTPKNAEISIDIFNSVIQVSHLIFHTDLIFEFTLPEITETKAHSVFEAALNFTKYYRTLFHFIISPNAP